MGSPFAGGPSRTAFARVSEFAVSEPRQIVPRFKKGQPRRAALGSTGRRGGRSGRDDAACYRFGDSASGTWRMLKAIFEHRRQRTGIMTTCFAEAGGFWKSRPDLPAPDIQYHFVPARLEDHGRTKVKGHGFSCHACVLRPESRGSVTLASGDAAMVHSHTRFLSR